MLSTKSVIKTSWSLWFPLADTVANFLCDICNFTDENVSWVNKQRVNIPPQLTQTGTKKCNNIFYQFESWILNNKFG